MTGKQEKVVHMVNEYIRAPRVQVINHEGQNIGVVSRDEALRLAQIQGLDLVMIAEQGHEGYPVTKIMDYGKALYAKKKKQAEAKKHQKTIQVKELKLRPKIGEHDFVTKMNQALQFLQEGKHVKITVAFRGRELISKEERGKQLFDKITQYFYDHGISQLFFEKDMKLGQLWSRIYYSKPGK